MCRRRRRRWPRPIDLPVSESGMHLFIRAFRLFTEIGRVTLRHGCYPSIGDYVIDERIEPAEWFKVLLLEALSIDCERRVIMWDVRRLRDDCDDMSPSSAAAASGGLAMPKRISESTFSSECSDLFSSAIEEVFSRTESLMQDYGRNAISQKQFQEKMMQLLHVHILPEIATSCEEIPLMQELMKQQEVHVASVDEEINLKTLEIERVTDAMHRQRQTLMLTLSDPGKYHTLRLPTKFCDALKVHLEQDIQRSNSELENAQEEVEKCKKVGSSLTMDEVSGQTVADCRAKRDGINDQHQRLLTARELLYELRRRSVKKLPESPRPLYDVYLGLNSRVCELEKGLQKLTNKKLLVISVKEAIRETIQLLEEGSESVKGIERDSNGGRACTDVVSDVSEMWQSTAQRINQILNDKSHSITIRHVSFCEYITQTCTEQDFASMLVTRQSGSSIFYVEQPIQDRAGHWELDAKEVCKVAITRLKEEILSHMNIMCDELQKCLSLLSSAAMRSVWLTYEVHFCNACLTPLTVLYEATYAHVGENLSRVIPHLSASELDIENSKLASLLSINDNAESLHEEQSESNALEELRQMDAGGTTLLILSKRSTLQAEPASPHAGRRSVLFRMDIVEQFEPCLLLMHQATQENVFSKRLYLLRQSLHSINDKMKQLSEFGLSMCADDLVDVIVLLLCNATSTLSLAAFYPTVQMLIDLLPPFFEAGGFDYTLIQFLGALNFLHDRVLIHQQEKPSAEET